MLVPLKSAIADILIKSLSVNKTGFRITGFRLMSGLALAEIADVIDGTVFCHVFQPFSTIFNFYIVFESWNRDYFFTVKNYSKVNFIFSLIVDGNIPVYQHRLAGNTYIRDPGNPNCPQAKINCPFYTGSKGFFFLVEYNHSSWFWDSYLSDGWNYRCSCTGSGIFFRSLNGIFWISFCDCSFSNIFPNSGT